MPLRSEISSVRSKLRERAAGRASVSGQRSGPAAEALELGLTHKDGSAALLAASADVRGLLGSVGGPRLRSTRLRGRDGGCARVCRGRRRGRRTWSGRRRARPRCKRDDLGRAGLLRGARDVDAAPGPACPRAPLRARPRRGPDPLQGRCAGCSSRRVVVEDLDAAARLVDELPDVVAVTRAGDVLGGVFAKAARRASRVSSRSQAALDQARASDVEPPRDASGCGSRSPRSAAARTDAQARGRRGAGRDCTSPTRRWPPSAEQLGQLGSAQPVGAAEADRLAARDRAAAEARDADIAGLEALEQRLRAARGVRARRRGHPRPARSCARGGARGAPIEIEARLALRTAEERARALRRVPRRSSRPLLAERQAARAAGAARPGAACRQRSPRPSTSLPPPCWSGCDPLADASAARDAATAAGPGGRGAVETRRAVRALEAELTALTDDVHRRSSSLAEQRLRSNSSSSACSTSSVSAWTTWSREYGPDVPAPVLDPTGWRPPTTVPMTRTIPSRTTRRRRRSRTTARSSSAGCVPPSGCSPSSARSTRSPSRSSPRSRSGTRS